MRPTMLRLAGFLLTVSAAVLAVALAVGSGRRPFGHVPLYCVVVIVMLAGAGLLTGGVDWTLLVGVLAVGWVIASGSSHPGLAAGELRFAWQGITAGLYLLALLASLQVSLLGEPLYGALDSLIAPLVNRLGLPFGLWPPALAGRADLWTQHPNSLAASALVPAIAAMTLERTAGRRLLVLIPAVTLIGLTGSRSALVGLGVGLLALLLKDELGRRTAVRGSRRQGRTGARAGHWMNSRAVMAALFGVLLVLTTIVAVPGLKARFAPWLGSDSFSAAAVDGEPSGNRFQSSEDLRDEVWWRPRVSVEAASSSSARSGSQGSVWLLTRTAGQPVDRIQQRVELAVEEPYWLSFEYRVGPGTPGLVAWGLEGDRPYGFTVREMEGQTSTPSWSGASTGDLKIDSVTTQDGGDGWLQVVVSFHLMKGPARPVEIGVAPDMSQPPTAVPLAVRELMLSVGKSEAAYLPTFPPDRSGLRAQSSIQTRLDLYKQVWGRIVERPVVGWGASGLSSLRAELEGTKLSGVAHEHSLALWAGLRYGLVGVGAMVVLFLGLWRQKPSQVSALLAVAAANIFDLTFWASGVALALAVVVGVRWKETDATA